MNYMGKLILFAKLVETGKRLKAEGKDIFNGTFNQPGNEHNIQFSYTKRGDVVDICYCYYGQMFNFTTKELNEQQPKELAK